MAKRILRSAVLSFLSVVTVGLSANEMQIIDFDQNVSAALASAFNGSAVNAAQCKLFAPAIKLGQRSMEESSQILCQTDENTLIYSLSQEEWRYHGASTFPRGVIFLGNTAKDLYDILEKSRGYNDSDILTESLQELFDGAYNYVWLDLSLKQPMPVAARQSEVVAMARMSCGYESITQPGAPLAPVYFCKFISSYDYPNDR